MTEAQRLARNVSRLQECDPVFALALRRTIDRMDAIGLRPRIQDAWRDPVDELRAFNEGRSEVRRGFHSCTGPAGEMQALAADVLDDDHPLDPGRRYLLALARAAEAEGLRTGIRWGLKQADRDAIDAALAEGDLDAPVKIGWDPTHAEITGLTIAEALAGQRPAPAVQTAQEPQSGAGPDQTTPGDGRPV